MDDEIVFEEPPTSTLGRPGIWPQRLAKVMERPGEWAKFTVPYGSANALYRPVKSMPGKWEITQRKNGTAMDMFVRYVGPS